MFGGLELKCPRLYFVGSMIEKVGDRNKVIISYGVTDCLSRFLVVDKADIAKMLWSPLQFAEATNKL